MSRFALLRSILFVIAGALLPTFAFAHTAAGGASSFIAGFMHPVGGLDHVCAMLAVGLWAAQMGGRYMWAMPLSFVSVIALSGALPMLGIGLPFVEQGIVLSVLLLGVLIAASVRLPLWLSCAIVGLFALWHGHAHGSGLPALLSGLPYISGFMLTTALLNVVGVVSGREMQRRWRAVMLSVLPE